MIWEDRVLGSLGTWEASPQLLNLGAATSAQEKLASKGRRATPSPPSWSPSRIYFPRGQAAKVRVGHKLILTTKLQGSRCHKTTRLEMPQDKEKAERGQVQQGRAGQWRKEGTRGTGLRSVCGVPTEPGTCFSSAQHHPPRPTPVLSIPFLCCSLSLPCFPHGLPE